VVSKTLTVDSGYLLTGPVYDASSSFVFVGDTNGVLSAVTASTFASPPGTLQVGQTHSGCTGAYNNELTDPPIVDSTNHWVYEYTTDNTSDGTAVEQASTSGPFSTTHSASVGTGDSSCNNSATFRTHAPDFDNTYYTGTVTSGHMWVCGRATNSGRPSLWVVPTSGTGGAFGTPAQISGGINTSTDHAECSPITEFYNTATTTDAIFLGEGLAGSYANFYGFTISGTSETALTPITGYPDATYNGGTSAAVIDNAANTTAYPEASSVYYTLLNPATSSATCGATGDYCAIKVTQAALGN
jgi:hypothetical protein